jgi:hypothetical protein
LAPPDNPPQMLGDEPMPELAAHELG